MSATLSDGHRHELRCICAHRPLLALYGIDDRNIVFVHVRVFKGNRVYHESVHYGGEVRIMCRDCYRWHRIVFVHESEIKLEEVPRPDELTPT